jgi:hypothetical protein
MRAMEQRCHCPSCNRDETWAGYYCEKCSYNWEEEAILCADGSIRGSSCPRCLKMTSASQVRCGRPACMAVWPPAEPSV